LNSYTAGTPIIFYTTSIGDNEFTLGMSNPIFVALISSYVLAVGVSVPMLILWAKLIA
jgi:hypothetical protein